MHKTIDISRYHDIIATGARYPSRSIGAATTRNVNLLLLLFHLKFLNFIENIGISDTRKYENKKMSPRISAHACSMPCSHSLPPTMSDDQKSACAGVGKPMNDVVWRVSMLNFARRQAENTAIRNAK